MKINKIQTNLCSKADQADPSLLSQTTDLSIKNIVLTNKKHSFLTIDFSTSLCRLIRTITIHSTAQIFQDPCAYQLDPFSFIECTYFFQDSSAHQSEPLTFTISKISKHPCAHQSEPFFTPQHNFLKISVLTNQSSPLNPLHRPLTIPVLTNQILHLSLFSTDFSTNQSFHFSLYSTDFSRSLSRKL